MPSLSFITSSFYEPPLSYETCYDVSLFTRSIPRPPFPKKKFPTPLQQSLHPPTFKASTFSYPQTHNDYLQSCQSTPFHNPPHLVRLTIHNTFPALISLTSAPPTPSLLPLPHPHQCQSANPHSHFVVLLDPQRKMGSCLSTTTPDIPTHPYPLRITHPTNTKKITHHTHQQTWLDHLPTRLAHKIAYFVTNGQPCLDGLRLAETSAQQSRAVLQALSHKFSNGCLDGLELRWAGIFRHRVREIYVTEGFYEGCAPLLRLLTAQSLRKVTLFGEDRVMRALAESASVRELTLSVSGDTTFETLNEMLYRLHLTRLTLICMCFYDEDECPFRAIADRRYIAGFAEACTKLKYLVIDCDHEFQEHPMWTLFKATPSVECTTLNADPPDAIITRLKEFKSVEIGCNVSDWKRLVRRIGRAVTLLETYCVTDDPALIKHAADLDGLRKCPNMMDLEICIANGVEDALVRLLPTFSRLKRLALRWVFVFTGDNTAEYARQLYHSPSPGILTKIVVACPKLSKLCLRCVGFSTEEQDAVLRALGSRLEEVEVSFNGQTEHTFDRMEAFLRSAIRYNHNLRRIVLVEEERGHRLSEIGTKPDIDVIEKQRTLLLHMLSILRRWSPSFDDSDMREYVSGLGIPQDPGVEVTVHHEDGSKTVYE